MGPEVLAAREAPSRTLGMPGKEMEMDQREKEWDPNILGNLQ